MLLYPLPALVTPPRWFINQGNVKTGRIPPSCSFPALMTLFPVIAFINEEATGWINEEVISAVNEAAIGAIIAGRR